MVKPSRRSAVEPFLAMEVLRAAIDQEHAGKHVIHMNAELDGTVGPILKVKADAAGVIYTFSDGDQPGVQMNLYRFVSGLGVKPAGYRSPSWDVNTWTPGILKRHGFLYDSSLMGNDVPYDVPSEQGPLIELPIQWLLDDAPLFRHVYGSTNAIADPGRVLQMWSKEFAAMHAENGCFILTCHPFVSGRASRIQLLEDLVGFMRKFRGVWFTTCEEIARWHATGKGRVAADGGPAAAKRKPASRRAARARR